MNQTLEFLRNKYKPEIVDGPGLQLKNINRTIMAQTLGELGFKEGAEVGVAEGYHAKVLLDNIPGLKLHCIDVWELYPGYAEYTNIEDVYKQAQERLRDYNCQLIKKFSMDAIKDFADNSLDFVYIDSAHDFKSVADDISEWSKKVKPGGIVFGHDYKQHRAFNDKGRTRHAVDVKPVVQAYVNTKGIDTFFVLTNDIVDPNFGPDSVGWLFVRTEEQVL